MKTGLVMEGGGMRGMFTCGVIDVWMEHDIVFDAGAGISAGAVFGCNYKSKQIGRPVRYNKTYCNDKRYSSMRSLLLTGNLYNTQFCYYEVPDKLDVFDRETFRTNPMAFYVGATDVETGGIVYHKCTDGGPNDVEWMRASASMPLVSRIVEVDGYKLLDGGIAESIPYRFMEELGYRHNVVILTQPRGFVKEKNKLLPLMRISLHKYPRMIEAIATRHIRYNELTAYIAEKERIGEAFVIRPPESLHIKNTTRDVNELERVYQIGRETATEQLSALQAFLAERSGDNE